MDTGDGMQRDFVLSDALAVCYDLPYYLQRNEKQKVDVGGYTDSYLCRDTMLRAVCTDHEFCIAVNRKKLYNSSQRRAGAKYKKNDQKGKENEIHFI